MKKFTPKNSNFEKTIREKLKGQHFMHLFGFEILNIEAGKITGQLSFDQIHQQQFGFLHGGVTSTISDIVMGFAAYSLMPSDKGVVTANLSVNYYHPGKGPTIEAVGWVEKVGRKMTFCKAEIFNVDGEDKVLIASAQSVMAVIERN
jgi:uncharacterized protein (TIGR00369 family)